MAVFRFNICMFAMLAGVILCLANVVWAQDGSDDGATESQQQETQPAPGAAAEEIENGADAAAGSDEESAAPDGKARVLDDDTFVPSEEISEDLSVSLPVDI